MNEFISKENRLIELCNEIVSTLRQSDRHLEQDAAKEIEAAINSLQAVQTILIRDTSLFSITQFIRANPLLEPCGYQEQPPPA